MFRPAWFERCIDWRNRTLASPAFQRNAARWWPGRLIARRRAAQVFDLMAGFVYSQVLFAMVKLRWFEILAAGALDAQALAQRSALPEAGTRRLLAAAAALRLVEQRGSRWGLGVLGAPLAGQPGLRALVEHHQFLYADLADPVALLRGEGRAGQLNGCWPYAGAQDAAALAGEQVAGYSRVMGLSQGLVADEILDAYPFHQHRRLLDVGGGDGSFIARVREHCPQLALSVFDLPAVAALARARLGEGVQVAGGNFHTDALPTGADLISLVRVVHDHDDEAAQALLARVAQALPSGGTVLLAEPMAATAGAEAMGDAYFGMYLLAMGSGRPRSEQQLRDMLQAAGFTSIRSHATRVPLTVRVLSATTCGVKNS